MTYFNFVMAASIALASFAIYTALRTAWQTANPRKSKGGNLIMYLPSGHRVTFKDYRGSVDFPLLEETLQRFEREESQQDASSETYRRGSRSQRGLKVRLALLPIFVASIIVGLLSFLGKPDLSGILLWAASPVVLTTIYALFFNVATMRMIRKIAKKLNQSGFSKHEDK